MLGFLTQERFPRLWLLFQYIFGATRAKRRLALQFLDNHKSVLEIGCSVGLVSEAFADKDELHYLGIDIDEGAIEFAKSRLDHLTNLRFEAVDIQVLSERGQQFEYVLFANILHHTDDELSVKLLKQASKLVSPNGIMVLMEPDMLRPTDGFLIQQLYKLERGQFRRSPDGYKNLIKAAGLECLEILSEDVSIDTLPGITCGHLLLFQVS